MNTVPRARDSVRWEKASEPGVAQLVDEVASTLGAPTSLINNAGVIRDNSLFKMSDDDWDVVMNVHLKGAFLMSRAVQSHMVSAGWAASSTVRALQFAGEGKRLLGSYMGDAVPARDIPRFLEDWRAGRLPIELLHTDTRPLDDLNESLDALHSGRVVRRLFRAG